VDFWVGRQPIFDGQVVVQAYELLYRQGQQGLRSSDQGDQATAQTIVHSLLDLGLPSLTGGRRAYINFTREMLLGGYVELLPKDGVVVEILETVDVDDAVVGVCSELQRAGYCLALDDFTPGDARGPALLPLCELVKVDFVETSEEERAALARALRPSGHTLVAEKVETEQEFEWARANGFSLHQGFFFARPTTVQGRVNPTAKLSYVRLLSTLRQPVLDFDELERTVKSDVALSHKLLRMLNSAGFGWRRRIESVRHALVALGEEAIRKWLSLVCIASIAADRPQELVVQSLSRAWFLEQLGPHVGMGDRKTDLFFMGIVSLLGALLLRPMDEIVEQLTLAKDVERGLLGQDGRMGEALELARALENADWRAVPVICGDLSTDPGIVARLYVDAVRETSRILGAED